MSIGTFLADENFGSWADEMEDMPVPAVLPSQTNYGGDRRAFGAAVPGLGNGLPERERGGYAIREPLPLPTQPPYTAHIGNLAFDATANDISNLFSDCGVTNVRIVEDKLTKAPKGFGYVEFGTVDGLKKALSLSGATLQGRVIRVSVADPPKDRPEVKEFDWTRKGPLSDVNQRRGSDRQGFGRNFESMSEAGSERGGGRRNFETREIGNWERKGPLSPISPGPGREGGRPRSNEGAGFRRSSPAWGEGRSQDGSRPPRREIHDRAPTAAELDNAWRDRMRPDLPVAKEPSNPPSPAAPSGPATRPKLNLQKRTVSEAISSPASTSGETMSSIFGGARPIDTAAREREVEEKRQLAIRQKKDAEEKAKAEKQRAAKEQTKTEKAATVPEDANGKDSVETLQGGKNFAVLRRAGEDENDMTADNDGDDQTTPITTEAPAQASASMDVPQNKTNGNWRSVPAQNVESAAADEEGWSTVSSKQRNNRRGQPGRNLA